MRRPLNRSLMWVGGLRLISGQFFRRAMPRSALPEVRPGQHNGSSYPTQELTMAPRVLYQRLYQHFRVCAPHLGVWSTQRLAVLVTGLLLARHTALPRLSAQLRRVTPTAQADSIERRLRR